MYARKMSSTQALVALATNRTTKHHLSKETFRCYCVPSDDTTTRGSGCRQSHDRPRWHLPKARSIERRWFEPVFVLCRETRPVRPSLLYVRMAVQNLSRRRARSLLLSLTVAIGGGAVFTAVVLRQAIQNSVNIGLARMGADLIVVPRDTTANLTSALLTVEPTDSTLAAEMLDRIASLPGVERVAPQRYIALGRPHGHDDLIAFDPRTDFTVLSWLQDKLSRDFEPGDLIVGARRDEAVGESINLVRPLLHRLWKAASHRRGPLRTIAVWQL